VRSNDRRFDGIRLLAFIFILPRVIRSRLDLHLDAADERSEGLVMTHQQAYTARDFDHLAKIRRPEPFAVDHVVCILTDGHLQTFRRKSNVLDGKVGPGPTVFVDRTPIAVRQDSMLCEIIHSSWTRSVRERSEMIGVVNYLRGNGVG